MKTMKHILSILFLSLTVIPMQAVLQRLPVELNFSSPAERAKWQFLNTSNAGPNTWIIGNQPDYAYGDSAMLYITNNGGAKRAYNEGTSAANYYRCMAYYPLDSLPAGRYILNFHYRGISAVNSSTFIFPRVVTNPDVYNWYDYTYSSGGDEGRWWRDASYPFTVDGTSQYYLCFHFYHDKYGAGTNPKEWLGYAIDAIQIYDAENAPYCAQTPQSLSMSRQGNDATFAWAGNASEYQVEYFLSDSSDHTRHTVDNITDTRYTFHSENIPEGTYHFRVRAICGLDTSAWAALDYQLVYDATLHCMDYLNFNDPNVKPQYGWFSWPWGTTGVYDRGFLSSESRHTVHHYPRDYDARTNYKLRTFPEGQPAAVRLGNWETGAQAEDIVYTMQITPEMGVLQLRYALVMQLPGHTPMQQPRFTLEFLDSVGNLIDSCGYVDFTASADLEGWHTEHVDGEADVIWKDWTLVGLNMRGYMGQTVQIRITSKDCSEGAHFGYAYFTLACSPGTMEGIHCGMKPDSFTVDEGFYYRWYRKYDSPRVILSTDRTYKLTNSVDTATYCVDMINMIDTACYFTLEASSLAYIPHAAGGAKYVPSNCQNYVQIVDSSTTEGVYWTPTGSKVVVKSTDGAEEYLWDFGSYGTSTSRNPMIAVADAGDTLHVVLHTFMENRMCEDTLAFDFVVPALEIKRTVENHYFCEGGSISLYGKTYTVEGDYTDTLKSWTGCDSLSILAIRYFLADTLHYYDSICASNGPLLWNGQSLSASGDYFASIKSHVYDCDSIYNILHLYVHPLLDMSVNYTTQSFCAGGGTIEVPYAIVAGTPTGYDLLFSDSAKLHGFTDRLDEPIPTMDGKVTIDFKDDVWAGYYGANLVFHNKECDTRTFPIHFVVYYDPGAIINQRWNDFLSVRKSAYDYYGGFTDYQWYKDGEPLSGQTGTQLYLPTEGLDAGSAYAVELTRVSDGVRVRTCDFFPTVQPTTVTLSVFPTVLSAQHLTPVTVRLDEGGQAYLYNRSGVRVGAWPVQQGDNQLEVPVEKGLYLLRVLTDSGEVVTQKLIVE